MRQNPGKNIIVKVKQGKKSVHFLYEPRERDTYTRTVDCSLAENLETFCFAEIIYGLRCYQFIHAYRGVLARCWPSLRNSVIPVPLCRLCGARASATPNLPSLRRHSLRGDQAELIWMAETAVHSSCKPASTWMTETSALPLR